MSKPYSKRDQEVIWHPFTQMKTAGEPIAIVKGENTLLFDEAGKTYIDAISSWWVNLHGHAHPYIIEKVNEQFKKLEQVIFAGFTHPAAVELAERLLKHLPDNQNRVFFSDDGSTAVEVAIKMALQFWHNQGITKTKIVALNDAYHGDTFGAMSVGGRSPFTSAFERFLFDVVHIDVPVKGREEAALKQLKEIVAEEEVAAFIFEPLVLGAGGMIMYEPDILDDMLALCKAKGVVTIADEVMTGFFRTGKFFSVDHLNHNPDIICMSKGLTGGVMPMGLTSCTGEIYDAFLSEDKFKTFFHGHSFTANALACAAALASLDLLEQQATREKINDIVAAHHTFAQELKTHPLTEHVRQTGTILAFDIKTGKSTSYFNTIKETAQTFFLEHGVLLRPLGNVLYIFPPYCITQEEMVRVYQVIRESLTYLKEKGAI